MVFANAPGMMMSFCRSTVYAAAMAVNSPWSAEVTTRP
jgi:hypothetical protein